MPLSLSEAADATGTNRTTILRAIKAGKISATKDAHGNWLVEPAELHRVYPPAEQRTGGERNASHYRAQIAEAAQAAQIAALRETADLMRAQVEDLRKDRDHWRDQAQAVTRQLADARVSQPAEAPRPWWRRLVG
jgi:excisionase family DNA binding protein